MTVDDNGIDISEGTFTTGSNGEVLTWDGAQWITVPATPLCNGGAVTITGSGGTVTINGQGITIGNAIVSSNTGTPFITWVNSQPQLELDLGEPEKKENFDGCSCKKCKELFPYAELPEDGSDFICWGCQHF